MPALLSVPPPPLAACCTIAHPASQDGWAALLCAVAAATQQPDNLTDLQNCTVQPFQMYMTGGSRNLLLLPGNLASAVQQGAATATLLHSCHTPSSRFLLYRASCMAATRSAALPCEGSRRSTS